MVVEEVDNVVLGDIEIVDGLNDILSLHWVGFAELRHEFTATIGAKVPFDVVSFVLDLAFFLLRWRVASACELKAVFLCLDAFARRTLVR